MTVSLDNVISKIHTTAIPSKRSKIIIRISQFLTGIFSFLKLSQMFGKPFEANVLNLNLYSSISFGSRLFEILHGLAYIIAPAILIQISFRIWNRSKINLGLYLCYITSFFLVFATWHTIL